MPPDDRTIRVFAKFPEPGRVKTRLIGPLSAEQAAELHRRCLSLTMGVLAGVKGARVVLCGSPDGADFSTLVDEGVEVRPQGGGDLGARLSRAIDAAFEAGGRRVIVVGSDCPVMGVEDVSRAFDLLERHDLVIGPATDGGYYLLGLCRPAPGLFEGVDWSSARVLEQTQARAAAAGLRVALLEARRDVDEIEDVAALVKEIPETDGRLGAFRAFLRTLIDEAARRMAPGRDRGQDA